MIRALLLLLMLAGIAPAAAQLPKNAAPAAALPASGALHPAQAQQTLDVLKDDKKRAALIGTLETIARANPAADATPLALPVPLEPGGVAAQTLSGLASFLDRLSAQSRAAVQGMERLPDLWRGFAEIANDPDQQRQLADAAWRFAAIMGAGLAAEWAVGRALRPSRRRLLHAPDSTAADLEHGGDEAGDDEPGTVEPAQSDTYGTPDSGADEVRPRRHATAWAFLQRLPLGLARLALDLLPVVAFLAVAHILLGSPLGGGERIRLVVLFLIYAYAIWRTALCFGRMMLSPDSARLRLLRLSDRAAAYLMRWLRRLAAVTVLGFALGAAGLLLGIAEETHQAWLKAVSLVVHVMLIVVVLQLRGPIARRLRAPKGATGAFAATCNGLAATWHITAIFVLAGTWLVWAVELPNGFPRLLRFLLVSGAILVASRLVLIVVLGTLDRAARHRLDATAPRSPFRARLRSYAPVARVTLTGLVYLVTLLALFQAWGFGALDWFTSAAGHRLLSSFVNIGITVGLGLLVWEWANIRVQAHLDRLTASHHATRAARLRTLLPLLRTTLLVALVIVVGLIVLSDIGVNIAPLLAGAGVLGIAIGFGSQKLVQDVITGLFLLLENTMQVGDVVTAGGLTGVVEHLTIRSIRLRSEDGSVHVIPFSAVTTVTNMTRDFGYAVIDAQVSYEDDYDEVAAVLTAIAAEMRAEPRWADEILDDIEMWGLDRFADSAIVVKARIRVGPFARWSVKREFNRRMKQRFDEHGIEIPYPHQQLVVPPGAGLQAPLPAPPGAPPDAPPAPIPEKKASREAVAREAAQ